LGKVRKKKSSFTSLRRSFYLYVNDNAKLFFLSLCYVARSDKQFGCLPASTTV